MEHYSIDFPSLRDVLYNANTMQDVWQGTIEVYDNQGNLFCQQMANQLRLINHLMIPENLRILNEFFRDFQHHLDAWKKEKGYVLTTYQRQKSFFSTYNKLKLFLTSGKPLSTLSDVLGYRIIIGSSQRDDANTIAACYDVLNELINFFSFEKKCSFLAAESRNGEDITREKAQMLNLCIPNKQAIVPGFSNNVKDYIAFPKFNGYQSLHLFVELPNRLVVEVQIRTPFMDRMAERNPETSHEAHKKSRYGNLLIPSNLDLHKLHINGFSPERDQVALINSIPYFVGIPS